MSASLVGSEMCIRDSIGRDRRLHATAHYLRHGCRAADIQERRVRLGAGDCGSSLEAEVESVSGKTGGRCGRKR
eukprot:2642602-Alexandrium_andersonii.AAC.1